MEHLTANISLLAFGIIDICLLLKLQNANCVLNDIELSAQNICCLKISCLLLQSYVLENDI